MMRNFAEFVFPGHPDKLSDAVADALRQLYLSSFTGDFEFDENFQQSH